MYISKSYTLSCLKTFNQNNRKEVQKFLYFYSPEVVKEIQKMEETLRNQIQNMMSMQKETEVAGGQEQLIPPVEGDFQTDLEPLIQIDIGISFKIFMLLNCIHLTDMKLLLLLLTSFLYSLSLKYGDHKWKPPVKSDQYPVCRF